MATTESRSGVTLPGLLGGFVFFAVVLLGAGYIVVAKIEGVAAVFVTLVPVLIMISYAALLAFARFFRLRDDQSGDNLYYMGFLFTLTSLGVSLYQFSDTGSAEQIVQNFGIAIASTICGIALRIFFNQMRRDPLEVESTARLELAEASRKVKRELEGSVLEFSYFRRATQQSLAEAIEEIGSQIKDAKEQYVKQLDELALSSSRPVEEASKKTGDAFEQMNARLSSALESSVKHMTDEVGKLSESTLLIVRAFDSIVTKLTTLQTPDQIIEIKLNPMIQGLSRAVNNFGKHAEMQAKAVDANLKQTQLLADALKVLLANAKARADRASGPAQMHPADVDPLQSSDVERPDA
jgi:hypothetical protein